jgi:hypothetical protein
MITSVKNKRRNANKYLNTQYEMAAFAKTVAERNDAAAKEHLSPRRAANSFRGILLGSRINFQ